MAMFNGANGFGDYTHCMLCETSIGNDSRIPCLGNFRALYVAFDGVELSEVRSIKEYGLTRVFANQNVRWDTMLDDGILLTATSFWPWDLFLFHEVCWQRFTEYFKPGEIKLSRLFEVLKRLPIQQESSIRRERYVHPLKIPSLSQLLRSSRSCPRRDFPNPSPEVTRTLSATNTPTDCFQSLPLEIQEVIAASLSTHDFLQLRCASRSMGALFCSPTFWKSRFELNNDRGFLHYLIQKPATKKPDQGIDWRLLYHSTCKMMFCPRLEEAIKVWEVFRWLRDALLTCENGREMPLLEFGGRALQHYHNDTCWSGTHIERTTIPPSLIKIGVSVLMGEGRTSNITGLEFITEDGSSVTIGYKSPEAELMTEEEASSRERWKLPKCRAHLKKGNSKSLEECYRYPGAHILLDVKLLQGISFQRDRNGIHTIALFRDTQPSMDVGMMDYSPHSEGYEVWMGKVMEVIATFDAEKMVHLGIRGLGNRPTPQWNEYCGPAFEESL